MLEDVPYSPLDLVVGVVLAIAILRGLFIGLIRETFSIAALGAAVLVVRFWAEPAGAWLAEATGGRTGPIPPDWLAGAALAIGTAVGVAAVGFFVRRSVRRVGLSLVDRAGGGALGAAEGVLVAMLIVLGTTYAIGRSHPAVSESRSLAAYDSIRTYAARAPEDLPDVAAPTPDSP